MPLERLSGYQNGAHVLGRSCPSSSQLLRFCGVLWICVDHGLHRTKLAIYFRVPVVLEFSIFPNAGRGVFIDSSLQLLINMLSVLI